MYGVQVAPDALAAAASDMVKIGAAVSDASEFAAVPTTSIFPAAADEVSSLLAELFSDVGREFQALSSQASEFQQLFVQTLHMSAASYLATEVENVINAPTEMLLGRPLIPTGAAPALGGAISNGTARAPLSIVNLTAPVVNASVGGGPAVPLLVDTGSTGLVIPLRDVGGLLGVLRLGIPIGGGISGYSGGFGYIYATYDMPVNFGGGLITAPTPVDVELFAFPTSIQSALTNGLSWQSFMAPTGAVGVLGVGPNAGGPGTSVPTQALAAPYNQGLLINEPQGYLQFGANPFTPYATVTGVPFTDLGVQVGNSPIQMVPSAIDSGGVEGTIPSSVIGNAAPGTRVTLYANGTEVGAYTYDGGPSSYYPTVTSGGVMNTGDGPFTVNPVYIDPNGVGTISFDTPGT